MLHDEHLPRDVQVRDAVPVQITERVRQPADRRQRGGRLEARSGGHGARRVGAVFRQRLGDEVLVPSLGDNGPGNENAWMAQTERDDARAMRETAHRPLDQGDIERRSRGGSRWLFWRRLPPPRLLLPFFWLLLPPHHTGAGYRPHPPPPHPPAPPLCLYPRAPRPHAS